MSKIEIDNNFQYFTGISKEVYLLVYLDKNLENNFQFKKFEDTTKFLVFLFLYNLNNLK